jgi:hypothetical protein
MNSELGLFKFDPYDEWNINLPSIYLGNAHLASSKKTSKGTELTYDLTIPLLDIHLKKCKSGYTRDTYILYSWQYCSQEPSFWNLGVQQMMNG